MAKKAILKILLVFLSGILVFIFGKITFLLMNTSIYHDIRFIDILSILYNGLSMDASMSGYIAVLPALLITISIVSGTNKVIEIISKIYFITISIILSLIITADDSLYSYWNFKLDATPLFYFFSSPTAAAASAEWWHYILFPILVAIITVGSYLLYYNSFKTGGKISKTHGKKQVISLSLSLITTALLFIPIRGGFTVSTMNLSRAYFSNDTRLNHAAVNPAFSLMYSLTHQNKFDRQFRFFGQDECERLFVSMKDTPSESDSISLQLTTIENPDIYLIILESFSSNLFPSSGGSPVALKLDSIAENGLSFTNAYAASFRTDRALPAVLAGYPGQPTTSIMKFVSKAENLPSIASTLKEKKGYDTEYFYGGDVNFTNMKSFLVSSGFDRIISDKDFDISKRLSKWGAHDEEVFDKAFEYILDRKPGKPVFTVIQTSSSHEPFEVPYDDKGRFIDKRQTAFAYTDSCASDFINRLHDTPEWDKSLIILVADHYGAWPELDEPVSRHHIPLIMTGGALAQKGKVETVVSQTDIAATLLQSLGLRSDDFPFSRNILNPDTPHFAFFADPSLIGFVTNDDTIVYNLESNTLIEGKDENANFAKAYLQEIYNDLSRR